MKRLTPNRPYAVAAVAVASAALVSGQMPMAGAAAAPNASAASSCGAWWTADRARLPDHGYDVDYYLRVRTCTSGSQKSWRFTTRVCNNKATGKGDRKAQLVRNGEIVWDYYNFTFPVVGDCRVLHNEGEWAGVRDKIKGSLFIEYAGQQDEADYLFVEYTTPSS